MGKFSRDTILILAMALACALVLGLFAPVGAQEDGSPAATAPDAPAADEPKPERGPCDPPLPEPTPEPEPVPDTDEGEPTDAAPEPTPEPVVVKRPPELAFVNGRCIPIAELNRLLAGYEGAVAEEAEALIELRYELATFEQLSEHLDATEAALANVVLRNASAESESRYAAMRETIAAEELTAVNTELVSQRDLLRSQAVDAYVSGGDPTLPVAAVVLTAEDLNELGSSRTYGQAIVERQSGRVELVEALQSLAVALEIELIDAREHAIEIEADVAAVRSSAAELRVQQSRLVDEAEAVTEVQAELVAEIQGRRDEFASELGFEVASAGTLGTVLAALGEGSASLADIGSLSAPLADTGVSSGFGPRQHPIFNEVRIHTGLDLNASAGTPIYAVGDGRVVVASQEGGYGMAIAIDHGGGISSLYAHQSAFAVGVGDEVSAGEIIGFVGSTGFSTGPHLHFELRLDGVPIDPLPFVAMQLGELPSETAVQTEG